MTVEMVSAEVMGELASPQDILDFDVQGIVDDLVHMQKQLEVGQEAIDKYNLTTEQLKEIENLQEVKSYRTEVRKANEAINNDAKSLKARLMKPYDEAMAKAKGVMGTLKDIDERMKFEVDTRAARERQEREDHLREVYATAAPVLMPVVPFERILKANADRKWFNKSTPIAKAEEQLIDYVDAIASSWETLQNSQLHYPKDAEAEYFRTLDIGAALKFDAEKFEEQQRIEAMKAEVEANKAALDKTYVTEGHDGEPVIVADTHHESVEDGSEACVYDVVDGIIDAPVVYLLAVRATKVQFEALKESMRENGIKGSALVRRDLDLEAGKRVIRNVR